MKRLTLWLLLLCCHFPTLKAGEALPIRVEQMLQSRLQTASDAPFEVAVRDQILARPDPGTFFLRYAYGLQRHAAKLLDGAQTGRLEGVLADHEGPHARWHGERNTLRCKFNEVLWQHAAASDADAAAALRAELDTWMQLRMTWTQQEHLAQYRFARDVWSVLTADQQQKLFTGEWKNYAQQDSGHTRGNATAKIITRGLGKPDDRAAFDAAIETWSRQRAPLHAAVSETESAERRIVFAMDLNSESMAHAASAAATQAYSALYLAEAAAIRDIVQAAYQQPIPLCKKAGAVAWSEAGERFQPQAAELIQLLSTPEN